MNRAGLLGVVYGGMDILLFVHKRICNVSQDCGRDREEERFF